MHSITAKLITKGALLYEGAVDAVTLLGKCGEFTVLPGHSPLIAIIDAGVVKVFIKKEQKRFFTSVGYVHVYPHMLEIVIARAVDVEKCNKKQIQNYLTAINEDNKQRESEYYQLEAQRKTKFYGALLDCLER